METTPPSHLAEFELPHPPSLSGTRVCVHRSGSGPSQQLTVRYHLRPCTQGEFSILRSYLLQSTREHLATAGCGMAVLGAHSSEPGRVFRIVLVATDAGTAFAPACSDTSAGGATPLPGPWWWTARPAGPRGDPGAPGGVHLCVSPSVLDTWCTMQGGGICGRVRVRYCPSEQRRLHLECERNVLVGMNPQSDMDWDGFVERMSLLCRRWPRVSLSSRSMLGVTVQVHSAQDIVGVTRGYAVICTEDAVDAILPLRQLIDRAIDETSAV